MPCCRAASVAFACLDSTLGFSGWPYHQPYHGTTFEQPARAAKVAGHTLCVENAGLSNYGGQYKTPLPLPFCLSQLIACRGSRLRIIEDCLAASTSLGAFRLDR